jgi:hypothetical protein
MTKALQFSIEQFFPLATRQSLFPGRLLFSPTKGFLSPLQYSESPKHYFCRAFLVIVLFHQILIKANNLYGRQ